MWAGELGDRNLRMESLRQTSFCLVEARSSGSSRATDLHVQMVPPRTLDCRRNAFPTRWRFLWKLRTWPARSSLFYILCAGFSWPNSVPCDHVGRFNSSHFTDEETEALVSSATFFFFFFWPCHTACGILVPQQGIESGPWAGRVRTSKELLN